MGKLLNEIERYWTNRAKGYSQVNQGELKSTQREKWQSVLLEELPKKPSKHLKILDIGTGPGFFAILLAEAGYQVTAVDYTDKMLEEAKKNAGDLKQHIVFRRMDAQRLEFEDNTFDAVISRNLTWNLEDPAQAYREWSRVLKPEGLLLNFDANWYRYLYDEKKREGYEQDRKNVEAHQVEDHYLGTDIDAMERIAQQVPMSRSDRPHWDLRVLEQTGLTEIRTDKEIWKRVWSEDEKLNYASTPMFLIKAKKGRQDSEESKEQKEKITQYWKKRSAAFLEQRREELKSPLAERWMTEIERRLLTGRKLKILDVGCGCGFFSILLAKRGWEVTGTDLTAEMIENAEILAAEEGVCCKFLRMDAEKLDFSEQTFDVVISRNLTWTLPHAEQAYAEWCRVLKPGGLLLNFDANYGAVNFAETQKLPKNHAHHSVGEQLLLECESIKRQLPISGFVRPAWDVDVLSGLGFEELWIDLGVSGRIYREKDEFYNPTPVFMIGGRKGTNV